MANIILTPHDELVKSILHSTSMAIGDLTEGVEVFCLYLGQNPQNYVDQLRLKVENSRGAWIILVDILGGSVHMALSQLTAPDSVTVLSGTSLNLVLSVLLDDHGDVSEKHMAHIMDEAKTGITCRKSTDKQEEEDSQERKKRET